MKAQTAKESANVAKRNMNKSTLSGKGRETKLLKNRAAAH